MTEIETILAVTREQVEKCPKTTPALIYLKVSHPDAGIFEGNVSPELADRIVKFVASEMTPQPDGEVGR